MVCFPCCLCVACFGSFSHVSSLCFGRKKVRERRRKLLLLCRHQLCGLSIQIPLKVIMMSCSLWMTSKVNLLNFEWSSIISLSSLLLVAILSQFSVCIWLLPIFSCALLRMFTIGFILVGADFDVSFHWSSGKHCWAIHQSTSRWKEAFLWRNTPGFCICSRFTSPKTRNWGCKWPKWELERPRYEIPGLFKSLDTYQCIRTWFPMKFWG